MSLNGGVRQREAKERFLELRKSTGKSIKNVMSMLERKEATYYTWMATDDEFKDRSRRLTHELRKSGPSHPEKPFDAAFRKEYFGLDTPLHIQLSMDLINDLKPGEAGAICIHPEGAKSAIAEDFISWNVAHNPDIRTLLVSKTQGHAQKLLGRVKRRMTDHGIAPKYIDDYGPFQPEHRDMAWTNSRITVARQTSGERDYTVEAIGVGGQVLGTRTDWMLLDDIAAPENQGEAEIEKLLEWVRLVAFTRVGISGSQLFIFNRIKEVDIYRHLFDEGYFDKTLVIPAERPPGYLNSYRIAPGYPPVMKEPDPGGFMWPERFPGRDGTPGGGYELIKKKVGARIWELNYQQKDEVSHGAKFPRDMVENCFNPTFKAQEVPPGYVVVTGIDPSAVNYSAGVALGINPKTKKLLLVDVWNEKGLVGDGGDILPGLVQFIVELNSKYGSRRCNLEHNSTFILLSSSLSLRSQLADLGVRLHPVRTLKQENDDLSIEQLSAVFANQMIDIPSRDGSKLHFREFIEQLVRWRPGDKKIVKDMVKAFQFAVIASRQYIQAQHEDYEYEGPALPSYVQRKQVVIKG